MEGALPLGLGLNRPGFSCYSPGQRSLWRLVERPRERWDPRKRLGITIIEEKIKANPWEALIGIVTIIIVPVLVVWSINLSGLFDGPSLYMLYISPLGSSYADDTYSDVQIAVNNGGNVAAEECSIKVYNHYLFYTSSDPDVTSVLGESEHFTLPPEGGRKTTVSIYLPNVSGEALYGGGVKSTIFFRTECDNAESDASSKTVLLSRTSPSQSDTAVRS